MPSSSQPAGNRSSSAPDFLIWQGATNGGDRGAYWLAPREAYELAGVAKVESHGLIGRAFYLEPDDDPDTDTKLVGLDLEYGLTEGGCAADAAPTSCIAAGYYNIVNSDIDTRDGMSVFDLRGDTRPLPSLPGVRVAGEFAYETNGSKLDAYGWYGELGYAADDLPWAPYLSYRYAFFSGDEGSSGSKSEAFDPLFYDGPDWGIWNQGEILGEWILSNSNLISHTVRLNAYPTDKLTLTALYYYFRLDDPGSAGVEDHDFAQEVNLIADYAVNGNLSVGVVAATSFPGDAAEQYTGGDQTWSQMILYATRIVLAVRRHVPRCGRSCSWPSRSSGQAPRRRIAAAPTSPASWPSAPTMPGAPGRPADASGRRPSSISMAPVPRVRR